MEEEMTPLAVRAFEVNVIGQDWSKTIWAASPGQAKYQYLLNVREAWPGLTFKNLTCHVCSQQPIESRLFRSCVESRGLTWKQGQPVRMGDRTGVLVDGAAGANFEVLFSDGQRAIVHPGDLKGL